ncbi:phosphatase and actin regulator 2 [Trichonephila clavipes]|nr:phosphatase and actin regulator 2 [Trichonephila clavipes]
MYKNALKEDLIRVVEDLDGTVESTDTIAKLKTKIEKSSTFESDPDFVKTLIKNCIDERVSRNERELECDIYISSRSGSHKETPITYGYTEDPFKNRSQNFKPKIKENYPQYLERENKNCFICGDSSHYTRDCEKRFKPKESNSHIHNRINANTLKVESEKQNDEFAHLQYVSIFVENQPVTALIDSGCQIPVLNSSLIRVNQPSEEIITLSSCFGEQRMVEFKPINISLNQHSPGLSVRTAISPTLTEEIIVHPSVYAEIKKLGHAKSDVLLNERESSLGAYAYPSVVSVSILCKKVNGAMKTSSVDFNSQQPNPLPMKSKHRWFALLRRIFQPWQWKRRKKRNRFEQTSRTLERKISMRSTKELIKKRSYACETQCFPIEPSGCRRVLVCSVFFVCFRFSSGLDEKGKKGSTAADSVQSGWPDVACSQKQSTVIPAQAQQIKTKTCELLREEKRTTEVREQALPSVYHRQTYLLE